MRYNYNGLWKILIDKQMIKKDLMAKASITSSTMARMGKELPVSLEVLGRICKTLQCTIGEIVEIVY